MGDLDVRIRHKGSSGPDYRVLLVLVAALAFFTGGGAVAGALSGLAAALEVVLMWIAGILIGFSVLLAALAIVFRERIRATMVRRGDPRGRIDEIERNKRIELARIRAMRLQIEAARIAGVEITDDILRMAEDPCLLDLVVRLRQAASGQDKWFSPNPGHEGVTHGQLPGRTQ